MTAAPLDHPEVSDTTGPTFLVIGAMKCATSTVCAYLEDHPDVFMVPRIEPNHFSRDGNWAKGMAYYAPFFRGAETYAERGEGSNDYDSALPPERRPDGGV